MIPYYYCVIKAKLKEIDDGLQKNIVLDVPFQLYSQVITDGNSDVTYSGRVKDRDVLAVVAVKTEDKDAIQKFAGWIGDEWAKVKVNVNYTSNYTIKISDTKKIVDELGNVTEYTGLDKDEPFKFAQWCEELKEIVKEDINA